MAIANKKVGLKHIFSGTNTLTTPFDSTGTYKGDTNHISLEVSRNFFVPINLSGEEVFFSTTETGKMENPLKDFEQFKEAPHPSKEPTATINREVASDEDSDGELKADDAFKSRDNIFSQLQALSSALESNDAKMIQGLLDKFDNTVSRLVTLRTRVGSIVNSVETSKASLGSENIDHASRRSALVDADVSELFSDINKQQAVLKTTYQASQGIMNQTLMDFLRR